MTEATNPNYTEPQLPSPNPTLLLYPAPDYYGLKPLLLRTLPYSCNMTCNGALTIATHRTQFLENLLALSPEAHTILMLSPIPHWRKATLILGEAKRNFTICTSDYHSYTVCNGTVNVADDIVLVSKNSFAWKHVLVHENIYILNCKPRCLPT